VDDGGRAPDVVLVADSLIWSACENSNGETAMNKRPVGTLLTTKEAAARMRVSTDWLTTQALRGGIASVKIGSPVGKRGGRRLFPESEIECWLSRNLKEA